MASRYTLEAGVHIVHTRANEVAFAGGRQALVLEGRYEPLLALCRCFANADGASTDEAIAWAMAAADTADERVQLLGDLPSIVDRMIECGLLTRAERMTGEASQSIVLAAERISPVVAPLFTAAGYRVAEHAVTGAADLSLVRDLLTDQASLLVAWSLNHRRLYAINGVALETKARWLFVAALPDKMVVSPLLRPGRSACFACLRFRSLGAMPDAMVGAAIESALVDGRPAVAAEAEPAIDDQIVAAGAAIKSLARPQQDIFRFVQRSGAVETASVLRLPNCPICSAR